MCSFYHTAKRYLTRHLPFANELFYDLAVLHLLMFKEVQACHVIRWFAKKLSHIIRQDYVGQLTDEWKIYQGQEIPEDWYIIGHQGDGSQHILKSFPLLKNIIRAAKLNRLTTLLCPIKACEGLLCLTHGNAEVERSLSENSKILTNERSLPCDDSINVIKLTKGAIWVNWSGRAHICYRRLRQPRRIDIHRTY